MRSRVAAALTVAAAGALIGAACGSGGQHGGRITAGGVARETTTAGSARIEITVTVPKDELIPEGTIRATGVADFRAGQGEMVSDIPGGHEEMRWIGTRSYMRFDGSAPAGPTVPGMPDLTGKWLTIDAPAAGFPALAPFGPSARPDQFLALLRDAAVGERVVGHETVRGVATTHLRLTVDVAKMMKQFADSQISVEPDPAAPKRAPADIWVDAQGRLRRMVGTDSGSDPSTLRLELWDYGVAVHVDAPPAADVVDLSKLGGAASASGVASASASMGKVTGRWHLAAQNTPGQPRWQLWVAPGTDGADCTSFENGGPDAPTSISLPPELKDFPNHDGFPAFCQPAPRPGEMSFPWMQSVDSEQGPAVSGFAGAGVERVTFVPKHGASDAVTPTGPDRVVVWTAPPNVTLDHVVVTGARGSVTCPVDPAGVPPVCPPLP